MVKFVKKIFNNLLLRSCKGYEVESLWKSYVDDIGRYINYVFYGHCSCAFVVMAT